MPASIIVAGIAMQFAVVMAKFYILSKIREYKERKLLAEQGDDPEDDDGFIMIPEHLENQTEIELKEIH